MKAAQVDGEPIDRLARDLGTNGFLHARNGGGRNGPCAQRLGLNGVLSQTTAQTTSRRNTATTAIKARSFIFLAWLKARSRSSNCISLNIANSFSMTGDVATSSRSWRKLHGCVSP